MSYIAALIIMTVKNELKAFTMMVNLLNRESLLNDFYQFNMNKINLEFETFMYLLSVRLPELHSKLKVSNLSCHIFLFEWIITLYSNIFNLDLCARIWDSILFHGEFYVIKIALAICQCV
jgi:TBC1 domain family member 14